ncbi:DUF1489 family protein [Tropicimonas sp. IMCC6043]|uniref:DUF1489 family protein n=1 Tax=Tropicimonas sp. IMCC6043 TaxID=2510645 RepID=UPI00101C086F|nr:DUF1489 domain-containing protein [Tropicimonas sp. IMCC6043]RYH10083.1 DUF1489 family protein [Tropicimonas sp. IMCC6043]
MSDSSLGHINLLKLCVGAERVEDLETWQESRRAAMPDGLPRHVTRMWPRREAELLNGGSLYWVFKGLILARQRVLRLDETLGADGISRCALVLDPEIHRTESVPKRPFQGWRYLAPEDAPRDLPAARASEDALPPALTAALAEIGVR